MKKIKSWRLKTKIQVIVVLILLASGICGFLNQPSGWRISLVEDVAFPKLSGPYAVGKTVYPVTDPLRDDRLLTDKPRAWMIRVFYPAQPEPGATPGPYVVAPLRSALAEIRAGNRDPQVFDHIHAHAYHQAPVAPHEGGYPLLLFSPGGQEQPLFYTSLLEQIASHGYVVVSVSEPHDTPMIAFPNGESIQATSGGIKQMLLCVQDTLCRRVMFGDQAALQEIMDMVRDDRPLDLISTLDQLTQFNQDDPLLAGHLDMTRVGAFGHSVGGASATRVGALDDRFGALAVLDSNIFLGITEDAAPLSQAVLYMASSGAELDKQGRQIVREQTEKTLAYLEQAATFSSLQITGTTHQNYQTDWALLAPYTKAFNEAGVLGEIDGARALQIITDYTVGFFDRYLRVNETALETTPHPDYPEVTRCCEF